ncbi:unannotated protein [freshwater metagenome]|uniref:Unannotated protein n=1 Tax=freshwater metagenome TaxID=449393 RepID=A0A6J6GBU7_9ZZZZ
MVKKRRSDGPFSVPTRSPPSLCRTILLTSEFNSVDEITKVESAAPVTASRFNFAVNVPPTRIFPSGCTAIELMTPVLVVNEASTEPSLKYRLIPKDPAATTFPSLCTATALTVVPGAAVNDASTVPSAFNRLRPPVKAPPTKIFPLASRAIALTVPPNADPTFVENAESTAPVSVSRLSRPVKLPPTRMWRTPLTDCSATA